MQNKEASSVNCTKLRVPLSGEIGAEIRGVDGKERGSMKESLKREVV